MTVLGVDIGATKIAAGRVDERARVSDPRILPSRASDGYEVSIGQLWNAIEQALTPALLAIGIRAPGPLNPRTGVGFNPPNLPGWNKVPLAQMVEQRYGLHCRVENDANAAGLAEALFGAARGYTNVFYATLSTGIGAGIILNGRIYHGKNGAAASRGGRTRQHRLSRWNALQLRSSRLHRGNRAGHRAHESRACTRADNRRHTRAPSGSPWRSG